jgi:dimethylhistidine N-methyltransferase
MLRPPTILNVLLYPVLITDNLINYLNYPMSILSNPSPSVSELYNRLQIDYLYQPHPCCNDGSDVIQGLIQSQKILSPHYFYDAKGSELFEKICDLPEYYPTRTEASILQKYGIEIAKLTGACELVELGSGSSTKTRLLLDAYQSLGYPLRYLPIDVSGSILEISANQLLVDYPTLQIHGLVSTYELALQQLNPSPLPKRMLGFLGSTLGNFNEDECEAFFSEITSTLAPGDYFLLGVDLQKSLDVLEAAYNDSQGVTAAFNLNILSHLNWRFQGDFKLNLFKHQAVYNQEKEQIEMYLICQQSHSVHLDALDLTVTFLEGESILTEISRKFDLQQIQEYLTSQGLTPLQSWTDTKGWFGVILAQLQG